MVENVLRRWMWRFLAVAVGTTLVLSILAGAVLAHLHLKPAPWFGILAAIIGALVSAGGLLPAIQHDLKQQRGRGGTDGVPPPGEAPRGRRPRRR